MGYKYGLIMTVNYFIEVLEWIIIIRIILSWFMAVNYSNNPVIRFVYAVSEPILGPFRRLWFRFGFSQNFMLDFSPVLAFIVLEYIFKPLVIRLIILLPF